MDGRRSRGVARRPRAQLAAIQHVVGGRVQPPPVRPAPSLENFPITPIQLKVSAFSSPRPSHGTFPSTASTRNEIVTPATRPVPDPIATTARTTPRAASCPQRRMPRWAPRCGSAPFRTCSWAGPATFGSAAPLTCRSAPRPAPRTRAFCTATPAARRGRRVVGRARVGRGRAPPPRARTWGRAAWRCRDGHRARPSRPGRGRPAGLGAGGAPPRRRGAPPNVICGCATGTAEATGSGAAPPLGGRAPPAGGATPGRRRRPTRQAPSRSPHVMPSSFSSTVFGAARCGQAGPSRACRRGRRRAASSDGAAAPLASPAGPGSGTAASSCSAPSGDTGSSGGRGFALGFACPGGGEATGRRGR